MSFTDLAEQARYCRQRYKARIKQAYQFIYVEDIMKAKAQAMDYLVCAAHMESEMESRTITLIKTQHGNHHS